jgi:hypothetical protein
MSFVTLKGGRQKLAWPLQMARRTPIFEGTTPLAAVTIPSLVGIHEDRFNKANLSVTGRTYRWSGRVGEADDTRLSGSNYFFAEASPREWRAVVDITPSEALIPSTHVPLTSIHLLHRRPLWAP